MDTIWAWAQPRSNENIYSFAMDFQKERVDGQGLSGTLSYVMHTSLNMQVKLIHPQCLTKHFS